jgi:integrase
MRSPDSHINYLNTAPISPAERGIIIGYIDQRNAISPTVTNTKLKQAYQGVWICKTLHNHHSHLDTATVKQFLLVAGDAANHTKDTRQTKISTLKAMAQYIHRFHHPIKNLDLLLHDVKSGSAAKNLKDGLTLDEWSRVINLPMSARDRAYLALLYDGCHRPREPLLLRWCDLRINESGDIEDTIVFKTKIPRTIVQKRETTEILEAWRRECGAKLTDETPIFPGRDGKPYHTITTVAKMFKKLRERAGIPRLKPSMIRNSALLHDVEAGLPVSYICLRAWGEPYNELINLYTKPDSGRIQRDQHAKNGTAAISPVLGASGKYGVDRIAKLEHRLAALEELADIKKPDGQAMPMK